MSSSQETRRHTVAEEQSITLSTHYKEVLEIPRSAAALVRVHTSEGYEGPDTLVFCSVDGFQGAGAPGPSRCLYWKEKGVKEGTSRGAGGGLEVSFTQAGNDSTKTEGPAPGRSALEDQEYALFWYPSGKTEGEPVQVFFGEPFGDVWSVGDTPSVMAHFGAVAFEECCAVTLPGEKPRSYDPEDPYQRKKDDPRLGEEAEDTTQEAPPQEGTTREGSSSTEEGGGTRPDMTVQGYYAEPVSTSGRPVKTRPASKGEAGSGADAPSFAWPAGDRWIHLFLRNDQGEGMDRPVQHLGTYHATEEGAYERAAFDGGGAPTVEGDPQKQVLVPYNSMEIGQRTTVLARLSLVPVSGEWVEEQTERLAGGWPPPGETGTFVPVIPAVRGSGMGEEPVSFGVLALGPFLGGAMYRGSLGLDRPKKEDDQLRLLLPNPLAVAERRLGIAAAAKGRFEDWANKMGRAGVLSSLVSRTCHGEGRSRSYLGERLETKPAKAEVTDSVLSYKYGSPMGGRFEPGRTRIRIVLVKKSYDMGRQWAPLVEEGGGEKEGESSEPAAGSLAAHFAYGAQKQRKYLRRRQRGAAAAVGRFVKSDLFARSLAVDALCADLGKRSVRRVVDRFIGIFPRCVEVGAGNGIASLMSDSGLLDAMARAGAPLAPLDEAASLPLADTLDSPAFKAVFKLVYRSPKLAQMLVPALAPAVLSWSAGRDVSFFGGAVRRDLPAVLGALRVHASWQPRNLGTETTLEVKEGQETAEERVRVAVEGDGRYRATVVRSTVARSEGGRESGAGGPEATNVRWSVTPGAGLADDLTAVRAALDRMKASLDGLDVVIRWHGVLNSAWTGTFGAKDTVDVAKGVADTAALFGSIVRHFGAAAVGKSSTMARAATVAGRIGTAAPVFDAVLSGMTLYQQASDVDTRGQAKVYDPNVLGTIGGGIGMVGAVGTLATMAGATAVATLGASLVVGVVGSALVWWSQELDEEEMKRADPLWNELPGTVWGSAAAVDYDPLFDLVRPGKDRDAPSLTAPDGPSAPTGRDTGQSGVVMDPPSSDSSGLLRAMRSDGETLADEGFHFPVTVSVREADGQVVGLELQVALGYVAEFGTLMVDAAVDSEFMPEPVPVRCAVHFVNDGDDFRYRVLPAEKTLDLSGGKDATLRDRAEDGRWAHSRTVDYTAPTGEEGEAESLSVRVGQWPEAFHSEERRAKARLARRMHVEEDLLIDEALREVGLHPGKNADAAQVANYQRAKGILRNAAPTSMLPAPEGFSAVLESGRFEVTGTVYFNPLRPFHPSPEVPDDEDLTAEEEIRFQYS